jgi:flavin-dependent dehydrogenase
VGDISTDVLIIGGGPAGLAAGIAARRRGLRALVADCAGPVIDKACGEGLMPDSLAALHVLGVDVDGLPARTFRGIKFIGPRQAVSADFADGLGVGIRRTLLHERLVEAAAAAGVEMAWRTRVSFDGERAELNGTPVYYRWVVGADGQNSQVRKWAGLFAGHDYDRRVGLRRHYQVAPWSNYVDIYWGDDKQAYVTAIAPSEVCVALISRWPVTSFDAAIASFPALYEHLKDAEQTSSVKGAVTVSRRLKSVWRDHVALIGEASGSVDAITGEGLGLCFREALALADAICDDDLSQYEVAHRQIMKLPQFMGHLMLLMDKNALLRKRALHALAANPNLFARLLAVHVGDAPLTGLGVGVLFNLGWQLLTA